MKYNGEEKRKQIQEIKYIENDNNYPYKTIISKTPYIEKPCYIKKEFFINTDEMKFYRTLEEIYKNTTKKIACQVAVNQILQVNERRKEIENEFNIAITKKSIDFVIFDILTRKIEICIELNGESHDEERRKKRDFHLKTVFEKAGITLIFFEKKDYYNQEEIKKKIEEK